MFFLIRRTLQNSNVIVYNKDYKFVIAEEDPIISIQILKGKYKDVVYNYGKVAIENKEELDIIQLNYDYEILESAGHEHLHKDMEFRYFIGDILVDILSNDNDEIVT